MVLSTGNHTCNIVVHVMSVTTLPCRGDSEIVQRDGIAAMLWRDNRVVTLLSTNTQPHEEEVVQRRQRDGSRVDVRCPAAVARYQQYMGGVDRNDQLRQYYMVPTKCRKFYKYIFWFLFESSITNAYILHSNYSGAQKMSLKEFRLDLAKGLIGDFYSKKRHNRHPAPPTNLTLLHFPMKHHDDTGKALRRRCWYCWSHSKKRNDTPWYCHECQHHFCHTGVQESDCFLKHHRK